MAHNPNEKTNIVRTATQNIAVIKSVTYCNRKAKKPPNYGKLNSFFPAHIGNHACVTQQK